MPDRCGLVRRRVLRRHRLAAPRVHLVAPLFLAPGHSEQLASLAVVQPLVEEQASRRPDHLRADLLEAP